MLVSCIKSFVICFTKNRTTFKILTFNMKRRSGSGSVPFQRFCFNENLLLPVYHCFRILILEMMFLALFLILYILKRFNYCSKRVSLNKFAPNVNNNFKLLKLYLHLRIQAASLYYTSSLMMESTSTTDLGLHNNLYFLYEAQRSHENVLRTIYLHFLSN